MLRSVTGERAQTDNRRLAWAISISLFFLTISVVGAKYPALLRPTLPPLELPMPEPVLPPEPTVLPNDPTEPNPIEEPEPFVPAPPALPNVPGGAGVFPIPAPPAQPPTDGEPNSSPSPKPGSGALLPPIDVLPQGDSAGHYPSPNYPNAMISRGVQGTVVLKITVDALGQKQSVDIKESSGYPELDEHARLWVRRYWTRFPKAAGPRAYHAPLSFKIAPAGTRTPVNTNP